jgi:hypothetical protein
MMSGEGVVAAVGVAMDEPLAESAGVEEESVAILSCSRCQC